MLRVSARFVSPLGLVLASLLAGCAAAPQPGCTPDSTVPGPTVLCTGPLSFQSKPDADKTGDDEIVLPPIATPYRKGSFAELLLSVITSSPEIGVASASELEAYAGVAAAQATQRPTVDINGTIGPQSTVYSTPPGTALRQEIGLTVNQTLFDFGASQNDVLRSQANHDAATQKRVAATASVTFDLVKAVLKYRIAATTVDVLTKNMGEYQNLADIIKLNETHGNASSADSQRANSRLERARSRLIDATSEREQAELELQRIAGMPVKTSGLTDLDRALLGAPSPSTLTGDDNPELLALLKDKEALEHQLEAVKASGKPTINAQLGVKYGINTSSPKDQTLNGNALLTLAMPVYDGGANQAQIDQVQARLIGTQQRIEVLKRQMSEKIENTKRTGAASNGKRTALAARVVSAQKVAALNLAKYKGGESTLFDLLDSYDDQASAELDMAQFDLDQEQLLAEALNIQGTLVQTLLKAAR